MSTTGDSRGEAIIDLGIGLRLANVLRPLGNWVWRKWTRHPRWRAFHPYAEYYQRYLQPGDRHALIQHNGPLVGDAALQMNLIQGLLAGKGAAVVWAPPGCGKSRFAIELAQRMHRVPRRWKVLFVAHDVSVVREELHDLTRLKRVVLVVDDAHECPELVKLLAAACAQAPATAPLYLVCLTRSTGRAQVMRALHTSFPPGVVQELDLGRPSTKLVRNLIEQLLPKSSPHHRDVIERFVRQSYFGAVLVCTILSRQGQLPQTFGRPELRDRICREPLRQSMKDLCPLETGLRALAVYAALTPVPKQSPAIREVAARLSALPASTVEILIERMLAAGLFQEYGRGLIRPIPDLLGDLILEEACLDLQGKSTPFSSQLLETLFEEDAVVTVANCADIGQLFGAADDVDLVSGMILAWARRVLREDKFDTMKLLQTVPPLTGRRPGTVVEMASILEARGVLRRDPPARELFGIDSVEMNTCALLFSAAEADPTYVPISLGLGRDLYAAARGDAQSRQHVLEYIEGHCRFEMGRPVAHARAVVNTLRTWVGESDVEAAMLAVTLSARFLALDVEGQRWESTSMTLLRSPLNPVPEVWGVRDVAIDTLVRGMSDQRADVQCAAAIALERYRHSGLPADRLPMANWVAQLEREIGALSAAGAALAQSTQSSPVAAAVELIGWQWWAQEEESLYRAGAAILESTSESDTYRLWKLLHAQRLPIWTMLPSLGLADLAARQEYFQELGTVREEEVAENARQLFDELDPRYPGIESWQVLWQTVLAQTPAQPLHYQVGAVVSEFARRHPDVAWSFVTEEHAEGPLRAILAFLLVALGTQDRARRSREASHVREGTHLEEAWFRALWFSEAPEAAERQLLARGLGSADAETRHRAAGALLSASGTERAEAFRAVFAAIAQYPADAGLWQVTVDRFVNWADKVLPPRPATLEAPLLEFTHELMDLLRTRGDQLRWGFGPHVHQVATMFAIFAVVCPEGLKAWMVSAWGEAQGAGHDDEDELPLSVGRLGEVMRLIVEAPMVDYWIRVFCDWMRQESKLATIGALGLAELCALDDPRVGELVMDIGNHSGEASVEALEQFVHHQKHDERFAQKALAVLEMWTRFPKSYARIEDAVIYALVYGSAGRRIGEPSRAHVRALQAIEARQAVGTGSGLLLTSLERASREVREAMRENTARDEESAP